MSIYELPEPKNTHYINRYCNFINSIQNTDITVYEVHHIIPRCLGGNNNPENLITLTPRQHFIAHWILWKAYKTKELTASFFAMCNQNNPYQSRNPKISSRVYETLRLQFVSNIKQSTIQLWKSEEYRIKHAATNNTTKTKELRSAKAKELWNDPEYRTKQINSRKKAWAEGRVNRDHSKCGVKGDMNPSRNPISVSKRSGDNYYTKREGYVKPNCVHCGKQATAANIKRWHGDNCKLA
jgi:hypothetical protein